jgi:hypothetical protein
MKVIARFAMLLSLYAAVARGQQKTPPSQDDLPAAPIKDADLFQVVTHQDGAATGYIYNYFETRDGTVWSVVCIGRSGADSACRIFHRRTGSFPDRN